MILLGTGFVPISASLIRKRKNAIKVEELLKKVKESENVAVAEIVDSDTYNQYLNGGCVRDKETGKPVAYVPPEPTAEEKAASKHHWTRNIRRPSRNWGSRYLLPISTTIPIRQLASKMSMQI